MTNVEFSNEFDSLLNSYAGNGSGIELDEYEKSVFLTEAQESFIINNYNGKLSGNSFENTEEVRRYLSNLVKTYSTTDKKTPAGFRGLSSNSVFFSLPDDLWFITYEAVNLKDDALGCKSGEDVCVTPITQDEYHRIKKNPFRGTNERRALRLDLSGQTVEIISKYNIESYLVRYLTRPTPIILTTLPDDLTINGEQNETECKLNSVVHRAILDIAVRLAIAHRASINTTAK